MFWKKKRRKRKHASHQKVRNLPEESKEDVFRMAKPEKPRVVAQELSPEQEKVTHIVLDRMVI